MTTFDIVDGDESILLANGGAIFVVEWLRSRITSQQRIVDIALTGPPIADDETGFLPLFQEGERGSIPLARRRNSNNDTSGFHFSSIRNRD